MSLGELVLDMLPLGLAIAASPFPIIPAILLLFTPRARANSFAFLTGWVVGVLLPTTVFVVLERFIETFDEPPTWLSWVRIALGATLLAMGGRRWLGRRSNQETPAWMRSIDALTPLPAARLALLLSAANPKVLLLALAAGLGIGASGLTAAGMTVSIVLFTAIASVSVAVPVLGYAIAGNRILGPLGRARDWLQVNNAVLMAVVLVLIGGLLIVKGIQGL